MILNYINVEDSSGQILRIRMSDLKMVGFAALDRSKYAEETRPITDEQERELWRNVVEGVIEYFGREITPEFRANLAKCFSGNIVLLEWDMETGELTLKENNQCQQSIPENTSTKVISSQQTTLRKAKPVVPSKGLKKSTRRSEKTVRR